MFYKLPSLPAIPDYLKQQIIDIAFTQRQQVVPTFGFKTLEYNNKIIKGSSYNRFLITDDILDWCQKNIYSELNKNFKIGVQIFEGGENYSPHIDGNRGTKILNYLVDPGGDSVETVWFQEKDKPLIRTDSKVFQSFNNLNERHRVKFTQDSWFIIQGNIIHAVLNLTRPRISLSIGFTESEFEQAQSVWYLGRDSNPQQHIV